MGSEEGGSGTVMSSSHSKRNVKEEVAVAGVGVWGVGEQAAARRQRTCKVVAAVRGGSRVADDGGEAEGVRLPV